MRKLLLAIALAALLGAILLGARCAARGSRSHRRAVPAAAGSVAGRAEPRWPDVRVRLRPAALAFPEGFGRRRVLVDPGHGALGNTGNRSASCEPEQDYTLALGRELASALERTGHFEARLSREDAQAVEYGSRVALAAEWRAEAFVSLHSDVRGRASSSGAGGAESCPQAAEEPGFAVLWSDEGNPELVAARLVLARAVALRLQDLGLVAYDGAGYREHYEPDPATAGVFVDRHAAAQRIFVLRSTKMPAILIETHNALFPEEGARWHEAQTREAFYSAVAAGLIDALAQP
jgi:N-acetylmuramoyl-L-alanine amidase